jgi:FAD/FMN-containing dehydrogenase
VSRSSGAYSLSIWTHNLNTIAHNASWSMPNGETENVLIVGSGNVWGDVYRAAAVQSRVVVGGGDATVGLGGFIQGGGHGPLSTTYGLAAQQVLQVTVIITECQVLVANDGQNQDLFWAVRGGGPGQYGIVTEYVLKTHPAPELVTIGTLQIAPGTDNCNISENATLNAAATLLGNIPDLMDSGLAGVSTLATGRRAMSFYPSLTEPPSGVMISQTFFGYNVTPAAMTALIDPVISRIRSNSSNSNSTLIITWAEPTVYQDFISFFEAISGTSNAAGAESLMSTRLLGRGELSELPQPELASFLKRALAAQNETAGTYATIGLQGGPGPASVSETRWGSVNPVWRSAYIHFISTGASIDSTTAGGPKEGLAEAADWLEENKEALFREWAPNTGAYMNEANPFDTQWKKDFYGEPYETLLEIKRKYDPTESLYILNGVGSDEWDYDLDSGKLCRTV